MSSKELRSTILEELVRAEQTAASYDTVFLIESINLDDKYVAYVNVFASRTGFVNGTNYLKIRGLQTLVTSQEKNGERFILAIRERKEALVRTHGWVYSITCKTTSKQYVGRTQQTPMRRWRQHVRAARYSTTNPPLAWAILTYGPKDFVVEGIERVVLAKLREREWHWIRELNTLVPNGYNKSHEGLWRDP